MQNIKVNASFEQSKAITKISFKDYFDNAIKNVKLSQLFISSDGIISIFFQAFILFFGGVQVINKIMSVGQLTVINTYFIKVLEIMKFYFSFGRVYQNAKASYVRLKELNDIQEEHNGDIKITKINNIKIKNLSFSYKNGIFFINHIGKEVIFVPGYIFQLTGLNGSGKTTYINILLGILQEIDSGSITYNELEIKTLDIYLLRQHNISVLLQSTAYPDETVSDYLLRSLNTTLEVLVADLNQNNFDFLLPHGIKNIQLLLKENINELSGGEKQTVELIRVFMKKTADIFILDEPSTALDDKSVDGLLQYLDSIRNDKIVILTSHDSRFQKVVDREIEVS